MTDYTPHLDEAISRLSHLVQLLRPLIAGSSAPGSSSHSSGPSSSATRLFAYHPPIIDDRAGPWVSDEPLGLRKYIESLETHLSILQAASESGLEQNEDPLPNVLGSITFAKTLLTSPGPLVGVKIMLSSQRKAGHDFANGAALALGRGNGGGKREGKRHIKRDKDEGFVDIVARGGQEWIRMYSKKIGHLLAEFREQDSYINSDFDSDSDSNSDPASSSACEVNGTDKNGSSSHTNGQTSKKPALTNSLLTMVDDLLTLAKTCARPPGAPIPSLTIRITRIEEFPEEPYEDDRIAATFQLIREKGVKLVFGDLEDTSLELPKTIWADQPLNPSRRINLCPTALLGICSDLLHHPLPADEEGAKRRFFRPQECLVQGREGRQGNEGAGGWKGQSQNSRELVKGILDEMEIPLIEEIRDRLGALQGEGEGSGIEFWATEETVLHVKEALGSEEIVGDGMEQRRMRRLIGLEDGDLFEGSRYEGKEGCLKGIKIKIFESEPESGPINQASTSKTTTTVTTTKKSPPTSFHSSLSAVCRQFLSEYYKTVSDPDSPESRIIPSFLHPRRLPVAKVAQLSRPFPIVSLHSFARGASEGMTTLTMGSVVFRELWSQSRWKPKGWHQSNYELERAAGAEAGSGDGNGSRGDAAVWMLPYRCMGEGKRVKFERGDYSYPTST